MKNLRKIIGIAAVFVFALSVYGQAFAETERDYRICDAWWQEEADGSLTARWEKPEASTGFQIHLYKGSSKKEIGAWTACSSNVKNYTANIVQKGTGVYYFAVYPKQLGSGAVVWSDPLEVDSNMITRARKALNNSGSSSQPVKKQTVRLDPVLDGMGPSAFNSTGGDRWLNITGGRWVRQKADNSVYKNTWLLVDGKWYLFDNSGVMQSGGWRKVDGKWYYLGADGAMWANTTTPDGYQVNGKGEWVQNGAVVTDSAKAVTQPVKSVSAGGPASAVTKGSSQSAAASGAASVGTVNISANETYTGVGKPKMLNISCSGASLAAVNYSIPYESWRPGQAVSVSVTIQPNAGYVFTSATRYSSSSVLTQTSNSGDASHRTLTFHYYPKMDLEQPSGFYMTDFYVLNWSKVPGASRYIIKATPDYGGTETMERDEPRCDLSNFSAFHARVTVTAAGPSGSKNVTSSQAYVIEDLDAFHDSSTVPGNLTIRDGKPYYENEYGQKGGWAQLAGSWYHFKNSGYADGPGWFKDTDENWYYFGSDYRMKTGWITDNGKQYFLNDGSNGKYPYGAWVK